MANARTTDPQTSHDAVAQVNTRPLTDKQRAIARVFRGCGAMSDYELVLQYNRYVKEMDLPMQSDSGIRTRRAELVKAGVLVLHGRTTLPNGNKANTHRFLPGAAV